MAYYTRYNSGETSGKVQITDDGVVTGKWDDGGNFGPIGPADTWADVKGGDQSSFQGRMQLYVNQLVAEAVNNPGVNNG